jgi:hypothetical protein
MATSRASRSRGWLALAGLAIAGVVAACGEQIESGTACPILCPEQNVTVLDTVFEAVVLDSSITGFPPFGTEPTLLLARRGDTVDTRVVIRFDSLLAFYTPLGGNATPIVEIDSAYLRLILDRPRSKYTAPVTIEVFNVDTLEPDTVTSLELALFRQDRRIGLATFDTSAIKDTISVKLDSATVMAALVDRNRLRLGLRATSPDPVMLHIMSREAGVPASVRYDASPDTLEGLVHTDPNSSLPASPVVRADFGDYVLVATAPQAPPGPVLTLGGLPGRRVYLGFDIPPRILDSSTVLRATLLLTQFPIRAIDVDLEMSLYPQLVTAGADVADLARAALLLAPAGIGFDTLRVTPGDSGAVDIEIVNAVRTWALPIAATARKAIVLRTPEEGIDPRQVAFFSIEAPPAVRPRLRISFSPRTSFGVP